MEKERRNISGMFFRYQNPETGKWGNVVFEDLPEDEQDKILEAKHPDFIKALAKNLANTINRISEQFDIVSD